MYQYNDIMLSVVRELNTKILNQSFTRLVDNDQSILPVNDYIPQIWENKWYNDDTIAGYSKGDGVWKYTITSADFIDTYSNLIHKYAEENPMTNGYLRYSADKYNDEIDRYINIISGYAIYTDIFDTAGDYVSTEWEQKLPPLFDVGFKTSSSKIEIFVSLIDDNKEYLSNSQAWTNIVLSNDLAFSTYISTEIELLFDKHIQDYHLGGISSKTDFANILLKRDFSNFDISALYNAQQLKNHTQYVNEQGFDYVREFKKDMVPTTLSSTDYSTYRWARLWNSGHLEHGGIIEIPKYSTISSTNPNDYIVQIDFSWADDLVYDYSTADGFYGDTTNNLYFANDVQINDYSSLADLKYNNRYSVSITPVQFNQNDLDYSATKMTTTSYPASPNTNLNKTFVNFEVHSMTNTGFCITRSRTDDLTNNNTIRYIQYYVSGYKINT